MSTKDRTDNVPATSLLAAYWLSNLTKQLQRYRSTVPGRGHSPNSWTQGPPSLTFPKKTTLVVSPAQWSTFCEVRFQSLLHGRAEVSQQLSGPRCHSQSFDESWRTFCSGPASTICDTALHCHRYDYFTVGLLLTRLLPPDIVKCSRSVFSRQCHYNQYL